MKVPISWLRELVDFDATPEDLAEKLTFSGVEVEGIEKTGSDYTNVVVGEITAITRHPGADRLRLCRVNDGRQEVAVVCGADNFKVGDKAPLARIGAKLANGMVIKETQIRGEISFGMLCAEDELGLSDDHSGIMVLPPDSRAGTPFARIAGEPDTVLDLEITWNRPDCLSMIGIAREAAALYGSRVKLPGVKYPEAGRPVKGYVRVAIKDPELCPRYTARVITDIKQRPSPQWMQRRLSMCGVRPINNVVDITNYVLLECGQPLHAFDCELVRDKQIIVRRASPGEKMKTLDGSLRNLAPEMLVIADAERAVALAGVMGGEGSEINDGTKNVLLESAAFDPASIHGTSAALGLGTESSYRFERGVDVEGVDWASRRATALMVELADAVAAKGVVDAYPNPRKGRKIKCRFGKVRDLIGADISNQKIVSILKSVQLKVEKAGKSDCIVTAPSFRRDLEIEADLVEEIARLNGLDKVPAIPPVAVVVPDAGDSASQAKDRLINDLVSLGLSQVVNYSFTSRELLDLFGGDTEGRRAVLPNPVSSDHGVMRDSLLPQMVETLGRNLARQVSDACFFEAGKVFFKESDRHIGEEERVCIGIMGKKIRPLLDRKRPVSADEVFLWLKGIVQAICRMEHVQDVDFQPLDKSCFRQGYAVLVLINREPCGEMGILSEDIASKWRMIEPVGIAEIREMPVISAVFRQMSIRPLPQYPSVDRDIAMIVPVGMKHEEIVKVIWKSAPGELTKVELFDIFTSKEMGEGFKSVAYALTYMSRKRTLTDEEANSYHQTIKEVLKKELGVQIRES